MRAQILRFINPLSRGGHKEQVLSSTMRPLEHAPVTVNQDIGNSPYVPLDPHSNEIRLASLAPGDYDDPLVIDLQIKRLPKDTGLDYEALSYVWGEESCEQKATVNDCTMNITTNLDCALRHLRYRTKSRILWIDALCINQNAVLERNSQVQMMGQIYSAASTVLIWLGPADAHTKRVVKFLLQPSDPDLQTIASLTEICQRPWFYRLWIYQELILADADPIIYIGHKFLPWKVFHDYMASAFGVSTWMRIVGSLDKSVRPSDIEEFETARVHVWKLGQQRLLRKHNQMSRTPLFSDDIMSTRFCQATDPRDKIFGLLGLHSSPSSAIPMKSDYTKTVQQVFVESSAYLLQRADAIALYLSFPLHEWHEDRAEPTPHIHGLPSWAVDFTIPSRSRKNHLYYSYHFSWPEDQDSYKRLSMPFVRFPKRNKLQTIGRYLGTIEHTSQALNMSHRRKSKQDTSIRGTLRILRDIYRKQMVPRGVSAGDFVYTLRPQRKSFYDLPDDEILLALVQILGISEDGLLPPKELLQAKELTETHLKIINLLLEYTAGETLFVTDTGTVGTAYHPDLKKGIRPGDVVVSLFRQNLPFVLRRVGSKQEYQMINAANVPPDSYHATGLDAGPAFNTEQDVWDNLGEYGLEEYIIV